MISKKLRRFLALRFLKPAHHTQIPSDNWGQAKIEKQSASASDILNLKQRLPADPHVLTLIMQNLSLHLLRELRSDHAGETGAVYIYKGIVAVATWRNDEELLSFAKRHGITEADHLGQIEAWLPTQQRSWLLGPWRLAGRFGRDLWSQVLGFELGFVGCGFSDATGQGVQDVTHFFSPWVRG